MTDKPAVQIPLPFSRFEKLDFSLYQPGKNREVVACLEKVAAGGEIGNIYLWGEAGTGKSHLLQSVCTSASTAGRSAAYIPLKDHAVLSPDMLSGLEDLDMVCIDDLDRIQEIESWEQALFTLFNGMRENRKPLIFSAGKSPKGICIKMPDLKSRLSWDLIYHLRLIDEKSLAIALKTRASGRMFDLPDDVIEYLIKRVARDTHTIFGILDKLDQASLQSKRRITIPFVKELLEIK